jgi:hypothetical protein
VNNLPERLNSIFLKLGSPFRVKLLFSFIFLFLFFIFLLGGIYFYGIKGGRGENLPTSGEYVTLQEINAYEMPNEKAKIGHIIPGQYFQILEKRERWLRIKITRIEKGAEGWILASQNGFKQAD